MDYKIIALDIDGTLTNSQKEITPRTRFAIIDAQKMGKKVVIASGRHPMGIQSIARDLLLDRYEGYPTFYYKKELVLPIKGIKTGKVRNRKVYVYIMHEDRPIGIPSKSYVRTCIEGYHNFGFDIDVLKNAYERSRKECLK